MSKSKLIIPHIKKPIKTLSKPSARLLKLTHKIPQILKSPSWEQILHDQIQQHDEEEEISYSALIENLAQQSNLFQEIESILQTMQTHQISPTREASSALIGAYSRAGLGGKAIELFSSMKEKLGSFPCTVDCNWFLKLLVETDWFDFAQKVYDEMLERDLADNYSTCIAVRMLCLQRKMDYARKLMDDRWGVGCVPNVVFYNTLMDGYFRNGDVRKGYAMFREMELKGFLPTLVSYGVVINGFVSNGNFQEVTKLIDEMKVKGMNPNVKIYNTIIVALCKRSLIREAKVVLRQMIVDGCEPDIITFNILISGLCRDGMVRKAEQVLRGAIGRRLDPTKSSYTPLIHEYCKRGEVLTALNLILEMTRCGHKPDLVTYGALIHGLVVTGELNEAMRVREKMRERGVHPDANIYNVLINGLCKKGMLSSAKTLVVEMLDQNILLDVFVYSTLIDGFVRNGDIDEAKKIFEFMGQKGIRYNIVVYNAMIKGYCKHGMMSIAISHVEKMRHDGFLPDEFTYTTMIDGYVKLGDLDGAMRVFGDMLKRNCNPNVVTYTALINGFCLKREFGTAENIFREMQSSGLAPNIVTYSILIGSYWKDNKIARAAAFFEEMLQHKCAPNDITNHYLINGLTNSIAALNSICTCGIQENGSALLGLFMNMVSDGWDHKTAAYNAIIFCLCKYQMVTKGLELRDKMILKGCLPDSITFLSLLHGICSDGKSGEWKSILSCDFQQNELEIAFAYAKLIERHINQGARSEVLSILQSLLDDIKITPEVANSICASGNCCIAPIYSLNGLSNSSLYGSEAKNPVCFIQLVSMDMECKQSTFIGTRILQMLIACSPYQVWKSLSKMVSPFFLLVSQSHPAEKIVAGYSTICPRPMDSFVNNENSTPLEDQPNGGTQGELSVTVAAPAEDGYSWRKYGQQQVKGSKGP